MNIFIVRILGIFKSVVKLAFQGKSILQSIDGYISFVGKEYEHLDWNARMRIIMGIAYCLQHMLELKPPVVFGQLQSKSILLTDDYAAKVHATLSCSFLCNFLPCTSICAHPIHVSADVH